MQGQLIEKAVAKVSSNLRKEPAHATLLVVNGSHVHGQERGAIDTPENFARFYMHLILERAASAPVHSLSPLE